MEAAAVSAAVSMTLKVVGNKLAPLLIKEYSNIVGVKTHLHELRNQVEDINNWLETRHEAMWNDPLFNWLKRLKDVAYDVDDVVDEFQLKAEKHEAATAGGLVSKYMFTKPKSFILECKIASKIKQIRKRFDAIVKQRADFNTLANSLPFGHPVHHMNKIAFEMQSLPVVDVASVLGRDQDKDKIITELVKSNVQQEIEIISVVGLGGSGKSTLAKLIFSDGETIKKHFELTLWVHVSQEFNIGKLIEKLFEAVTKEKSDKYPMQCISEEIPNRLNQKKFLIVLDDVWTEDRIQWEQFMVHLKNGAPGSKILLTTRSRRVAEAMESIYIFDLPFLSLHDSWQVFHNSFGAGATGLSPEFQEVAQEIVRKCGGVPLAIKSLAGVLRGIKRRIEDWQAMRDNNLLNVQEEERVAACLRLSYSHLESDLKQCFTICSVFPKGHKIDKGQLIDLWIAHDIITMDCIGNKHFNSLVQISFLQNVEEEDGRVTCRMHDLVHDLAMLILGDEISLIVPMEEQNSTKSYRYFSLREQPEVIVPINTFRKACVIYFSKCYDHIFGMALENAKHLRSVIVGSPYVTALPNAMFQIKYLKYLFMSRLNCEALPDAISDVWSLQALYITDSLHLLRLPESIGKLKKLRTLNLSGCRYLSRLPDSIGDCHMISNIDLWHCEDLTVLPNSIGRNKELKVLRLGCCTRLRSLPSIITLENLECLDLRMCHELEKLPKGTTNLKKLEVLNLEGCIKIRSLLVLRRQVDWVQHVYISVVGRGKKSAQISEHENSDFEDLPLGHTYVMEPDDAHRTWLKQKTNLKWLRLEWKAHDTAELNNEFVEATLDDLEPPPGIELLEIDGYSGRQYAGWMQNQVGGGVQGPAPFPFLRVMNLFHFPNLKNLCGLVKLPSLEELSVIDMPCLESISGGPFHSLVKLRMRNLPCLREVWIVAEGTMIDGEESGCCCNVTRQLGQVRVGNCLRELVATKCPKLEVKPHLPMSIQYLCSGDSEHLLQSPGQCEGSSLSPNFSHLKKLELLNVTGLGSSHGWELLQHMTTLETLHIWNFSGDTGVQTELPQSLWSLTSLRSLKVMGWPNICVLPESLGDFRSLQELSIQFCNILTSLPQSIGQLTSLQMLSIAWCDALYQLPDYLGELCSLRKLEISRLPGLTCLPESICSLATSLQELKIFNCPGITTLPQGMEGFVSLQKLSIRDCAGLTSLPQGMEGLVSLKELDVSSCPGIKSLPEGIKGLTALKKLQIRGCRDLQRRCRRGIGEDWHLISHIPDVFV